MTTSRVLKSPAVLRSASSRVLIVMRVAAVLCVCAAFVEALAFCAATALASRNLLYYPPSIKEIVDGEAELDPILGWPSRKMLAHGFDERGARVDPSFSSQHEVCMSIYGGTLAYGAQVADEKTWSALLSQRLGCRVANYGVAGYGTDQAYLRYSINRADNAPVVVLTVFSGDIRRNVNQFRNLLSHNSSAQMKPRFVFERGLLTYVPPPRFGPDQASEFIRYPERLLSHEYFLPGRGDGVIEARFPFSIAVGELLFSRQLQASMHHEPAWAEFYDSAHPSQAFQVTAGIIERFVSEAVQRSQEPVIAIAPEPAEFFFAAARGELTYAPLLRELSARGIGVLDVGQKMLEAASGESPCSLASDTNCSGVFSEEGHRLIASIIGELFHGVETSRVKLLQAKAASSRVAVRLPAE